MSDEKIKFKLDLDSAEFIEKGLQAKSTIQGIGSKENLTELLEGLTQTSAILGTVGVAAFSVKKAIDFTLEAESIQRVEKQFETLTEQAGISGDALKEGLIKSAQGLVDTSDLLEVANKKIVAMGGSAEKLPEIMDLATKASQVYGGTVLENFDEISTAIANGNTRMLKHKGILIDSQKAMQDYAAANGIAVNEISEVGKRQAILNEALEKGKTAYAGVEVDLHTATNTLQLLKVTLKDLGEAFSLAFEKTLGPTVRSFLVTVKDMAAGVKENFQAAFGEGLEKNTAQITLVESKIKDLGTTLEQLKAKQGTKFDFAPAETAARIQGITEKLKENEAELGNLKKARQGLTKVEETGAAESSALGKKGLAEDAVNQQTRAQNRAKYQAEVSKLDNAALKLEEKNIKTLSDVDATVKNQRLARQTAHEADIQQIQNATFLNETQKADLIAKADANFKTQAEVDARDTATLRKKLLDDYVRNSTDAFDGISRSFQANSEKAKLDLTDMGKRGEEVFKSIQSNSVSAFEAMGAAIVQGQNIAEAAGKAILKIFLGTLADRAIAEGSVLLASSLINPINIAPGVALIALGGALKAAAGGMGGSGVSIPSATSSGGGGGGGGTLTQSAATAGGSDSGTGGAKATTITANQDALLAQQQKNNDDATAAEQAISNQAAQDEKTRQEQFQAAALQSQQEAQDKIAAQLADRTAAQSALASTAPEASTSPGVTPINQDQQLANTATQSAQRQKVVQVHIAGNYLDTDQTRRQLMELIRQETDATAFEYKKIGV